VTVAATPRGRIRAAGVVLAGRVAAVLLRCLGTTWRTTIEGPDPLTPSHESVVAAFWHRNVLVAAHHYRDRDFSAAVSRSRDGDLVAALLVALGYRDPPRGSSTRGGPAALRELVRLVEAGATVSIQTDGPQGPARISKSGVLNLARLTGRPVTPVAFSASRALQFASWDQTLLPAPFARIVCRYADPLIVPADADDAALDEIRRRLDHELNEMTDELDRHLGREAKI
jgi:lysophospholipid acyltransferase (LPLAT)-like uncharacterized protein